MFQFPIEPKQADHDQVNEDSEMMDPIGLEPSKQDFESSDFCDSESQGQASERVLRRAYTDRARSPVN